MGGEGALHRKMPFHCWLLLHCLNKSPVAFKSSQVRAWGNQYATFDGISKRVSKLTSFLNPVPEASKANLLPSSHTTWRHKPRQLATAICSFVISTDAILERKQKGLTRWRNESEWLKNCPHFYSPVFLTVVFNGGHLSTVEHTMCKKQCTSSHLLRL